VIRSRDENDTVRRLADLRRAQPTDATLRNLLAVLTEKLDLCARLPVFEWEAESEGHAGCASAFRSLADAELRTCAEVLDCLREQLNSRGALAERSQG
jgi:hypothetical protein